MLEENQNIYKDQNTISLNLDVIKDENKNEDCDSDTLKAIKNYMEGRSAREFDLSYEWILNEPNISSISKSIVVDDKVLNSLTINRDLNCELKLLKLLTEDDKHKIMLITIPKICRKLNRYPDIIPCKVNFYNIMPVDKHNTIFLDKELEIKSATEDVSSDEILSNYVNASYITGPLPDDKDLFIATQGPVTYTIEAFWKMILIKNIKLIIMLTNLKEENRNKCELYWPSSDDSPITYGNYKIYLDTEVIILDKAIIQRNFVIENESEKIKHNCTQLQVICWEDHSAPQEELGFKMIEMIFSYVDEERNQNKNSPVVVHCSAGLGRTGTFIAIYNICRCLTIINNLNKNSKPKILPFFSVFSVVRKLREERFSMVTDSIQYKFIYQFIIEWVKRNYEF